MAKGENLTWHYFFNFRGIVKIELNKMFMTGEIKHPSLFENRRCASLERSFVCFRDLSSFSYCFIVY